MNAIQNVSVTLTYTYSDRSVDYDENAFLSLVPMANYVPTGGATISVYDYLKANGLTGFGPYAGYPTTPLTGDAAIYSPNNNIVPQSLYGSRNNVNELLGLRRYNMADRTRNKFRARMDLQASENLTFDGSVDYNQDDYDHSLYGLTSAESWAANVEGAYTFNEGLNGHIYYSYQTSDTDSASRAYGSNSNTAFVGVAANTAISGGCYATVKERNNNAKIDDCLEWTSSSNDKVYSFGAGLAYQGLMDGKLSVAGDLVASRALTDVGILGGSYVNNPLAVSGRPPVSPAVYYIPASNFPTAKTDTLEFTLDVRWALSAVSDLRMMYVYAHMKSSDYFYDGTSLGSLAIVMPTNETAPSYNVNVVGFTYTYHMQ